MKRRIASRRSTLIVALMLAACGAHGAASERDEMERRLLACAGCHDSPDGESPPYAPSITGKPAEYLYRQLLNYRDGRRSNGTMSGMLAYLDDAYLHEIANHYARLPARDFHVEGDLPEQSPARAAAARTLVHAGSDGPACVDCHGDDLRGDGVAIPSLRGLSPTYIAAQLGAWRANTRHARAPDCMKDVADGLASEEIGAVAGWIAHSFEPPSTPTPPEADVRSLCGALR